MNLNLITSLDPTGYGYTGRSILSELTRAGVAVALFPLDRGVHVTDDPQDPVRLALGNAGMYNSRAPCVRIARRDARRACWPRQARGLSDFRT